MLITSFLITDDDADWPFRREREILLAACSINFPFSKRNGSRGERERGLQLEGVGRSWNRVEGVKCDQCL
jgi:hypothetical protein